MNPRIRFTDLIIGLVLAVTLIGSVSLLSHSPSVQLVENKLQETKTVCVEKDIDWVYGYNKNNWQRLQQLPEDGLIEKSIYNLSKPSAFVTINRDKANISAPSKVVYKAVSECVEHKQIPKYSDVKVTDQ